MFFFSIYFCLCSSLGLKIFAPFSESNLNGNGIVQLPPLKIAADQCWACTGVLGGLINGRAYIPRGLKNRNGDEKYHLQLLVFNLASMRHNKSNSFQHKLKWAYIWGLIIRCRSVSLYMGL